MTNPLTRRGALAAALMFTIASGLAAAGAVDTRQASAQFERALQGEASAIEPAAEAWQKVMAAAPADPLARAYFGAATTMRATTTWLPWRKIAHVEDGLAAIDKALAQLGAAHDRPEPDRPAVSLQTRFVAASTFLALPAMFNRTVRGQRLLDEVRAHPAYAQAPASFRAQVESKAAEARIAQKER